MEKYFDSIFEEFNLNKFDAGMIATVVGSTPSAHDGPDLSDVQKGAEVLAVFHELLAERKDIGPEGRAIHQELGELARYLAKIEVAYSELNTPEIDDFLKAVEREALHQRDRWGAEHDAGKRPEDWIALVTYLLGKATKAHYDRDDDKLLHHVITIAAACLNWHAAQLGAHNKMRPGVDR